jgi:hypothetical protein
VAGVFVSVLVLLALGQTRYAQEAVAKTLCVGVPQMLSRLTLGRLAEFGQLALNIPQSLLPAPLRPALVLVGTIALALVVRGLWIARGRTGVFHVGVGGYLVILAAWPYLDPRFFLPVLPLLAVLLLLGIGGARTLEGPDRPGSPALPCCVAGRETNQQARGPTVRAALRAAWLVVFVAMGSAAFAYSTRITLAERRIGYVYGDGTLTATYRAALLDTASIPESEINARALRLLRRFEPLASRRIDGTNEGRIVSQASTPAPIQ